MILNSSAIGVPDVVKGDIFVLANVKVNTLFVSYIFNTKHGLEELTKEEYDAAALIDDDIEGTREERTFRLWINSLGIDNVHVENLYDDCADGVLLCKVIHRINENVIDWKKVKMEPKQDFDKNINNNTAVEGAKSLKCKIIGVGGNDITKKDKKLTLAVVW